MIGRRLVSQRTELIRCLQKLTRTAKPQPFSCRSHGTGVGKRRDCATVLQMSLLRIERPAGSRAPESCWSVTGPLHERHNRTRRHHDFDKERGMATRTRKFPIPFAAEQAIDSTLHNSNVSRCHETSSCAGNCTVAIDAALILSCTLGAFIVRGTRKRPVRCSGNAC